MARVVTAGAEIGEVTSEGLPWVSGTSGAAVTVQTSIVRSGARAWRLRTGSVSTGSSRISFSIGATGGVRAFGRAYLYFDDWPVNTMLVCGFGLASEMGAITARLTPTGTLQLWNQLSGLQVGSDSAALSKNTWYRVEMELWLAAGANCDVELRIDGSTVARALNETIASSGMSWWSVAAGFSSYAAGKDMSVYVDDVAVNGTAGTSSQRSFPGEGKVVLLLPVSDNARATLWTGGVGGTTNLWDAVNNIPPAGHSTETNLTQIEHAGSSAGTTDAYDANLATYSSAGIAAGDTVNAVAMVEADGEDSGTGTKLLAFSMVSNPAIASPGNVTAGDDIGALGIYPSNWVTRTAGHTSDPVVTLGTSPVMRVVRPETVSRVASVCLMGLYVDYTPAPVAARPQIMWVT
jgi:hypothetical protein